MTTRTPLMFVLSGLLLLVASPGQAQNSDFSSLPGLSRSQRATAAGIQTTCERLAPMSRNLTGAQLDLFQRCREMVQTSNQLQGNTNNSAFSLNLSNQSLGDVLTQIAPEPSATQGTSAVETASPTFRAVGARLAALRRGARGLSVAGVTIDADGTTLTAGQPPPGGGASADVEGGGRLGVFLNGTGAFGSKDRTSQEEGFDFFSWGLIGGVDYRVTNSLIVGGAVSFTRSDADLDLSLGDVVANNYGITLYGTYYVNDFYVDFHAGYNFIDYDTTRHIAFAGAAPSTTVVERTARGSTEGNQFTVGVGAGYAFRAGSLTVTPYGRVEYLHLDIDGYQEHGASGLDLTVRGQTVESLQTAFGGSLAYAFSVPFGVVTPQVHAEWRHEYLNDARSITARYTNDPFNTFFAIPTDAPDRDFFAVGAGVSATFRKGMAAFFNFETILGLRDVTNHEFTAGLRVEF